MLVLSRQRDQSIVIGDGIEVTVVDMPGLIPVPIVNPGSVCGIYFLCRECEVVYVGQSVNVLARVHQHLADKEFAQAYFMPVPQRELDRVEREWIDRLMPEYNDDMATRRNRRRMEGVANG